MKSILVAAAAVVGFAGAALAEGPQLLTDDQMDQVVAGGTHTISAPGTLVDGAVAGGGGLSGGGAGGLDAALGTLPSGAGGFGTNGGGGGCGLQGPHACP